ncbi:MAG TPA: hypothetical protein VGC74_08645, partial [Stenotrophomonas sp.]
RALRRPVGVVGQWAMDGPRAVSAAMDGRSNRDPPSRQGGARTASQRHQPPNTLSANNKNPNSQAAI